MNERLPYEDSINRQLNELNELPLPDQELAWEKMQLLLDKDDDGPLLVPPIIRVGCLGWALLLVTIMAVSWFLVRPDNWFDSSSARRESQRLPVKDQGSSDTSETPVQEETVTRPVKINGSKGENKNIPSGDTSTAKIEKGKKDSIVTKYNSATENKPDKKPNAGTGKKRKVRQSGINLTRVHGTMEKNRTVKNSTVPKTGKDQTEGLTVPGIKQVPESRKDATGILVNEKRDTSEKPVAKNDSIINDSVAMNTRARDDLKKEKKDSVKKFFFSAGLGLQQQVPIGGQSTTPYNYYGRKGSLADYIPSVYLRLHREGIWFMEGGFRYGAPQSVKEVNYSQQTSSQVDTSQGQPVITTTSYSTRLKKTFYHQLPISFNYHLFPNWTVGAGIQYSRFHGAVSEEEISIRRNQVDSFSSKKIVQVPASTDSFFTKSQVHILFQSEYQWRRWGAGVRYTKGLQPFIKYTDASGVFRKETNQSLQLFLRFRIWQSRK